jgi:hypothetical protein
VGVEVSGRALTTLADVVLEHGESVLPRQRSNQSIGVDVAFPFDRQIVMGCGAALWGAAFGGAVLLPKAWPRHSIARSAVKQRLPAGAWDVA